MTGEKALTIQLLITILGIVLYEIVSDIIHLTISAVSVYVFRV